MSLKQCLSIYKTPLRLLIHVQPQKSGVRVSNITSWHQTPRALPSPINSLFPLPFPFPFPLPLSHQFTIPPLTTTPANPQALAHSPCKQSKQSKQSKRPCRFRKISKFFLLVQTPQTYMQMDFIYTNIYLQALRNKVFWSDTSNAYGRNDHSYALLAARRAEGETLFDTMHVK